MRLAISTTETLTDLKTDLVVANNNNMRKCEGDGNSGVRDGVGVVEVSAEYVGGRHDSGIVSSAADVLGMSVVCETGGVLDMCLCNNRGWYRWGVGKGIRTGPGRVGWCYVCVTVSPDSLRRWHVQVSVYCAWKIPSVEGSPARLRTFVCHFVLPSDRHD